MQLAPTRLSRSATALSGGRSALKMLKRFQMIGVSWAVAAVILIFFAFSGRDDAGVVCSDFDGF